MFQLHDAYVLNTREGLAATCSVLEVLSSNGQRSVRVIRASGNIARLRRELPASSQTPETLAGDISGANFDKT